jgi:hypothetical protein
LWGENFCSTPNCSKISLYRGQDLLADNLVPDQKGEFSATVNLNVPPGMYALTASQKILGKDTTAIVYVLVTLGGDDEEANPKSIPFYSLFLPLVQLLK